MRVQHVDGEYRVVLTAEAMEALHRTAGPAAELRPVEGVAGDANEASGPEAAGHTYAMPEQGIEAYLRTEPQHADTYRELAK